MAHGGYVTETEFRNQGLPSEALDGITTTMIEEAIKWASRKADSYLAKRYKLPLSEYSFDLRGAVTDLAVYYIMSRRGFAPGSGADEVIVKRHDDAILWLRDISTGKAELAEVVDSSVEVEEAGTQSSTDELIDFNWQTRGTC